MEKNSKEEKAIFSEEQNNINYVSDNILSASAVFGQTESEIEREYKDFKANKLLKRIIYSAVTVTSDCEAEEVAEDCKKYSFGKVLVLPQYAGVFMKMLYGKGVDVICAVNYPYGAETVDSSYKNIARAAAFAPSSILFPFPIAEFKRGNADKVAKYLKKDVKAAKNVDFIVGIDCGQLNEEELARAINICRLLGIKSFAGPDGCFGQRDIFNETKRLKTAAGTGSALYTFTSIDDEEKVLLYLTMSDHVISSAAASLAKKISEKLK